MKRLLFFSLLVLAPNARAGNSCSTIDLRDESPVLMQSRSQGDSAWCYAYAVADLLSYKLGQDVSAADVAMNYTGGMFGTIDRRWLGKGELDEKGGRLPGAAKIALARGACLEERFHSDEIGVFHPDGNMEMKDIGTEIRELERDAEHLDNIRRIVSSGRVDAGACHELAMDPGVRVSRQLFPLLSLEESVTTFVAAKRWNVVRKFQEAACRDRVKLPPGTQAVSVGCSFCNFSVGTDSIYKAINAQLDKHNIVAISYDVAKLSNWVQGGHASTIVGRQKNEATGQCEYLVRDNTGPQKDVCEVYQNTKFHCDRNGYVWIPEASLSPALRSATYLEKR